MLRKFQRHGNYCTPSLPGKTVQYVCCHLFHCQGGGAASTVTKRFASTHFFFTSFVRYSRSVAIHLLIAHSHSFPSKKQRLRNNIYPKNVAHVFASCPHSRVFVVRVPIMVMFIIIMTTTHHMATWLDSFSFINIHSINHSFSHQEIKSFVHSCADRSFIIIQYHRHKSSASIQHSDQKRPITVIKSMAIHGTTQQYQRCTPSTSTDTLTTTTINSTSHTAIVIVIIVLHAYPLLIPCC